MSRKIIFLTGLVTTPITTEQRPCIRTTVFHGMVSYKVLFELELDWLRKKNTDVPAYLMLSLKMLDQLLLCLESSLTRAASFDIYSSSPWLLHKATPSSMIPCLTLPASLHPTLVTLKNSILFFDEQFES